MQRVRKDARAAESKIYAENDRRGGACARAGEGERPLTSRELGTALWSSAACFAVLKSMHEVREAIRSAQ